MGESIQEASTRLQMWLAEGMKPELIGDDGFPLYPNDPLAPFHRQISAYLKEASKTKYFWDIKTENFPAGVAIMGSSREEKAQYLRAILVRLNFWNNQQKSRHRNLVVLMTLSQAALEQAPDRVMLRSLISDLMRAQPPLTSGDVAALVSLVSEDERMPGYTFSRWQAVSADGVMHAVECHVSASGLSPDLRQELKLWSQYFESRPKLASPERKLFTRLKALLGDSSDPGIVQGEAWSNAALEDLKQMTGEQCSHWIKLLHHCRQAETSKPTKKWLKTAKDLIEPLGLDEFKSRVLKWFELIALPRPIHQEPRDPRYEPDPDQLIADGNSVILKGLAWSCAGWQDKDVSRALSRLAEVCFKKIRNLGPRCPRIGNACLYSLSDTVSDDAAAELSRLNQMVKQPSAKKLIGKSLDKAAELSGQTREDLEESTVPTYGLDAAGCVKHSFGTYTATFCITGPKAMELTWLKADGNPQKSVPAEVKESHADDFKKLKRTLQDIEKMVPAQRHRLERLLMSEREWTLDKWFDRYLIHPLLSFLARRLIWHFKCGDQAALGTWLAGKLVDVQDHALDWLGPETKVRLWHPIGFDIETVAAWRRWLETHQIAQPFKQAHREVYILTDAEQQTDSYSNRFAAHIIGQHQFVALAKHRGWKYSFMGGFDVQSTPTIELPAWGLVAEYWVEPTNELAETGVSRYLATDQVRFARDGASVSLSDVPAIVFSEIMRDVDLFVGVCSIGNDPEWQDRGDVPGGGNYWQGYSFGDLSASANTRRDVLERLLPKLKIAGQCELKGKFLSVRGTFRTYKIHLGSGNILMEPNDRYLCIVPGRGATSKLSDKVFLPFEGDNTLSIILSKAFLLADDAKIKDPAILSQIKT